jgi:hypothetical protein
VSVVLPCTELPGIVALMIVVPCAAAVARPCVPEALLTVAMLVADDAQVTVVVRSSIVPFEYVPFAVYCCVPGARSAGTIRVYTGMVTFAGVTAMDTSVALAPVSAVVHEIWLVAAAVIVVEPTPATVASPWDPAALLIVATAEADEDQVAADVRFWVEPSE